jgi:hypothetical protein
MVDTVRVNENFRHLPRLTVGRTVLARETWWLPPIGRTRRDQNLVPANQRAMWRIKQEFGLPDQAYVRFAEEPWPARSWRVRPSRVTPPCGSWPIRASDRMESASLRPSGRRSAIRC